MRPLDNIHSPRQDSNIPLPLHVLDPTLRPPGSEIFEILHTASREALLRSGNCAYIEVCNKLDESRQAYDKLLSALTAQSTAMRATAAESLPSSDTASSNEPPPPFREPQANPSCSTLIPTSVLTKNPLEKPLVAENYPAVPYWFEHDYNRRNLPIGPRGITLTLTEANKADQKTCAFVTNQDGTPIPDYRVAQIRFACRSAMSKFEPNPPETFTKLAHNVDLIATFYETIYSQCPELRLCDNNWKAKVIASNLYSDWHRYFLRRTSGALVKGTRKRTNGDHVSTTSKKQKTGSRSGLEASVPAQSSSTSTSSSLQSPALPGGADIVPSDAPCQPQPDAHTSASPMPMSCRSSPAVQCADDSPDATTNTALAATVLLDLASGSSSRNVVGCETEVSVRQVEDRQAADSSAMSTSDLQVLALPYGGAIRDPLTGQPISREQPAVASTSEATNQCTEAVNVPRSTNEDADVRPLLDVPHDNQPDATPITATTRKRTGATLMRPSSSKTPRNLFAKDYFKKHPGLKITVNEFEKVWIGLDASEVQHWNDVSRASKKTV